MIFEILISVLLTAILALIVMKRSGYDLLGQIDDFLHVQKHSFAPKITQAILKALTSEEDKQNQLCWVRKFDGCIKELRKIQQREIYLLDERDTLEKGALAGSLIPDEQKQFEQTEKELDEFPVRLYRFGQKMKEVCYKFTIGAWASEYVTTGEEIQWQSDDFACAVRFGCCFRDCGCCKKPRKTQKGQYGTFGKNKSHCTIECGCCIRWRGVRFPDEPKKK